MVENENSRASASADKPEEDGLKQLWARLESETEPLVPADFPKQVERDMTGGGRLAVCRRLAMAYLARVFSDVAEKVEADRDLAVALAHAADVIESNLPAYKTLLDWLDVAVFRMRASIAVREDMQAVLKEAGRLADEGDNEQQQLTLLRLMKRPERPS